MLSINSKIFERSEVKTIKIRYRLNEFMLPAGQSEKRCYVATRIEYKLRYTGFEKQKRDTIKTILLLSDKFMENKNYVLRRTVKSRLK